MNRLLAASAGIALGLMSATIQAGPPQTTTLSRTTEVRRLDDLEPRSPQPVSRGASPAVGAVLPVTYPPKGVASGPVLPPPGGEMVTGTPMPVEPVSEAWNSAPKGFGYSAPTLYASGEYLLWWIKDSNYPVLASTGPFRLNPPGTQPPFV